MQVGYLGDLIFSVSWDKVMTPRGITKSGSANIQSHSRHLSGPVQEFTGAEDDGIEFSLRLSKHLGADPAVEMDKIEQYTKTGKTLVLVIGKNKIGYKWLIKKYKFKTEHTDKRGNPVSVDASITLVGYSKG